MYIHGRCLFALAVEGAPIAPAPPPPGALAALALASPPALTALLRLLPRMSVLPV